MGYPGFDFPNKGRSFVPAKDVLEFLLAYVDEYGLKEKIRLEHLVVRVTPLDNGKWEVIQSVRLSFPRVKFRYTLFSLSVDGGEESEE